MKLRTLVINAWVHVFRKVVSGDSGMMAGRLNDMYLFERFLLGESNEENWGDHRNNFFINNSVELSMCDGPIETVKHI